MKSKILIIIGLILLIGGIGTFAYNRFSYTTEEKVAEIGVADANIKLSAQKEKSISIPPAVSGLSVAAGLVLIFLGSWRKSS